MFPLHYQHASQLWIATWASPGDDTLSNNIWLDGMTIYYQSTVIKMSSVINTVIYKLKAKVISAELFLKINQRRYHKMDYSVSNLRLIDNFRKAGSKLPESCLRMNQGWMYSIWCWMFTMALTVLRFRQSPVSLSWLYARGLDVWVSTDKTTSLTKFCQPPLNPLPI